MINYHYALNFKPIGTGPFKFDKYVKGTYVRVVRNEDYSREGQPYLDEIVFRIIPDWSAQVAAFETGEISSLVFSIPRHELPRLAKLPGTKVEIMTPLNNGTLWTRFNLRHEALKNQKVREALQWATDKDEILKKAYYGQGWTANGFINPENPIVSWAYNADVPKYGYDPEKAKQLLDKAGFLPKENGIRFSIRQYNSASDIEAGKANEMLREQWRKVGIELKAMPLEGTAYPQLVYHKWDFDLAMGLWSFGPDPGIVGMHVLSSQIRKGLAPSNVMGSENPKVDELLQQASGKLDRKERGKLYGELAKILNTDLPGMWFIHYKLPFVYNDKFVGLPIPPQGYAGDYDGVWCKDCK
ncbi:MAG: hypothetical protein JRH18_21670 [Deltaproteobacteria bacterium]|nr:hypothetical protein [Deltaproteobacteria bacterium]MBW2154261.1 hypothetical protein [Deltaproteobacteria bacterium]